MKRTVTVWGDKVEVDVHQKSKSVWIASGEYLGKQYQSEGRSETQAASALAEQMRYMTN